MFEITLIYFLSSYSKVSGLAKIALTSRQMNTAFSEAAKAVGDELNSKYNLIRQAASEGYRPYGKFMEEIMTEIEKNYPTVDMTLIRYFTTHHSRNEKRKHNPTATKYEIKLGRLLYYFTFGLSFISER